MKRHYLLIDTDTWAGNFERLLCAAVTGVAMEDTATDEVRAVAAAYDGPDLGEVVGVEKDKHNRPRHCWCDITPGTETRNTVRITLYEELDDETLAGIKARAEAQAAKGFMYSSPFRILAVRTAYEEPLPRDQLV